MVLVRKVLRHEKEAIVLPTHRPGRSRFSLLRFDEIEERPAVRRPTPFEGGALLQRHASNRAEIHGVSYVFPIPDDAALTDFVTPTTPEQ
jgi:hypothetical protein